MLEQKWAILLIDWGYPLIDWGSVQLQIVWKQPLNLTFHQSKYESLQEEDKDIQSIKLSLQSFIPNVWNSIKVKQELIEIQ